MDALTPELELRLRAELEQQIASLKAALENMKAESERWRTIAECAGCCPTGGLRAPLLGGSRGNGGGG
jgi:hypothetical protein